MLKMNIDEELNNRVDTRNLICENYFKVDNLKNNLENIIQKLEEEQSILIKTIRNSEELNELLQLYLIKRIDLEENVNPKGKIIFDYFDKTKKLSIYKNKLEELKDELEVLKNIITSNEKMTELFKIYLIEDNNSHIPKIF